jgi:hypothetical protein
VTELLWILAALAGIVVVSMGVTVLLVRALYRRIRRSRAVGGAVLHTRAALSSGPQRRVLQLRIRLEQSLASAQAALDLAAQDRGPRSELARLFARIRAEGGAVHAQLRLLESERDPAVLAQELPAAARRTELVAEMVSGLRSAVASGLGGVTDGSLTALRSDVEREVAALHAGEQELITLSRPDPVLQPITQPSTGRLDRRDRRSS